MKTSVEHLSKQIISLPPAEAIALLANAFPGKVVFSSSFSWEDQAIAHLILSNKIPVDIFTLDTGRLFSETYSVWSRTNELYQTHIKALYPRYETLQAYLDENGPNAFYDSVELRKQCCFIRKVEPLKRALAGNAVWITGLRAAHSPERETLPQVEWDEDNQLIKFHPILYWSTAELRSFIQYNHIPYNTLHDKGFISIGCAPCTRAVKEGEDFRAGRWWWENKEQKECGLHTHTGTEKR